MELKINTKDLNKALSQLLPIIPSRTPLEILTHFLLTVKDNILTIRATDSNVAYQKSLPVFTNGEISAAIPGKLFHDTISSLHDTDLKIVFNQDERRCVIYTDTGKYSISYILAGEFPAYPDIQNETVSFTINGERLKRAINITSFACAKEEARPAMQGILMDIKKDKIVFVSTDGHRLVKLDFNDFGTDVEYQAIIPAKSSEYLSKILDEKDVKVAIGDKLIKFEIDGGVFISRLIDDTYPNYESVIPLDNDNVMKINRVELLKTLKRANYYVNSKIRRVDFEISKDMLSFTAENPELGIQMNEKVLCEYKNEPLNVAFKLDFITDIMEHINLDDVLFKFNTPSRPCLIEPAEQVENENLIILVMPMRVNI